PAHRWVGISGRARVITYNTDSLSTDDLPADLMSFTDPVWKGRIGLPPTNTSFQTMVTALRNSWGEEKTRAWLEGIMANEPVFYEKNTPTVSAVASGEVEVGFVNHYYLFRFLAEEGSQFSARNHYLTAGGPGSLVMVSGAGQLTSSQHPESAIRFLEFLLSPKAQTYFANNTFEYPLIDGIEIHPDLVPLAELNSINMPLEDLSDLQGTVILLQAVGMLP
ncbi:MAG: extracellular solute-binding protein, partial [Chloroflexota bacterium]